MYARIRRPDSSRGYREVLLVEPRSAAHYFVAAPGDDTSRDPARSARSHAITALSLGPYLVLAGWRRMGGRP